MRRTTLRLLLCLCTLLLVMSANAQNTKTVTGQVTDSTGQPVGGVSILLPDGKVVGVSDDKGAFSVSVPDNVKDLQLKHVSYQALDVSIGSDGNVMVMLAPAKVNNDEVVVTALGIKKDVRKLGYATSLIKGDDIVKTAPTNFASALYGKAPGVMITSNAGGATSAVSIQIRGINSIGYQRQPLMVVDGIIVRDGDANNDGYWGGNQRINGNGLLDINPENIESINILKGAAASALYGSDATFGVIVITTKNGKGLDRGLGVDVSIAGGTEKAAVVPDVQTEYGPGYDRFTNLANTGSMDGWRKMLVNGDTVSYPYLRAYAQFGPKFDGRPFYYWDGTMRNYTGTNNWNAFYRTGYNSMATVALHNSSDKLSYRFSYTRNDYKGVQIGGKQGKNTFNLNTTYKISSKLTADVVVNYINEFVHNRPRQTYYLTNNYGGFFSSADKMDAFFNNYKTPNGYKWQDYNSTIDLTNRLKYNIRSKDFLDFLWNQLANSYNETTNRLIASATLNYNIIDGLNLRGRIGTDYTGYHLEEQDPSTQPIAYGPTGYYGVQNNQYTFTSGDLLLSYNKTLDKHFSLTASAGYQARKEFYSYVNAGTSGGLSVENWYSMSASASSYNTGGSTRKYLTKDGLFGILDLSYNDYLFVTGTIRRERTSTLYPGQNAFNYPGVSAAFELSRALNLPKFISYSKLRAAWGIVGNPADPYTANVVYTATNINGIPSMTPPAKSYGNNGLKNEMKHELEFGWETKMLNNRLGFDVSYYNNKIVDQILNLTTPSNIGATSVLVNVGNMRNYGVELSLYGQPIKTNNFLWDVRLNMGFNRNKVISLMQGLDQLQLANFDNTSMTIIARPGHASGDIMGYVNKVDSKGNKIVGPDGYYEIDYSQMVNVGNIQPKTTGGIVNTFTYKSFSLTSVVDYHWGGQIVSLARLYGLGAGLYKNTLHGRDADHGGLAYDLDANNNIIPNPNGTYHDGIVLKGVTDNGATNTKMLDAPSYYMNTYTWGGYAGSGSPSNYPEGAVYDNNFVKLREISIAYTIPAHISRSLHLKNLVVSVYGRNLFYIYKSLPGMDPEGGVGTQYVNYASSIGSATAPSRSIGAMLRVSF